MRYLVRLQVHQRTLLCLKHCCGDLLPAIVRSVVALFQEQQHPCGLDVLAVAAEFVDPSQSNGNLMSQALNAVVAQAEPFMGVSNYAI